jgi:cyclophilin family peptidyl-prolyl cis-trans isomerase
MIRNHLIHLLVLAVLTLGVLGVTAAEAANPTVIVKTSKGDITIELYPDKAPTSVQNFLAYVDAKFFDGTIFHRVIKGFMIQGGGLTPDFKEKPERAPIKNEAGNGLKNLRGTIAMARTDQPHSATAQWFINHADNAFLDHKDNSVAGFGYCVFGKVIAGLDVVDAIALVPTATIKGNEDAPRTPVTILSVRRAEAK